MAKKDVDIDGIMQDIIDKTPYYKNKDNESEIYANIYYDDHFEYVNINSKKYHAYNRSYFRDLSKLNRFVPHFNDLISIKKDETILFGESITIYRRSAGNSDKICYFLGDRYCKSVVITENGWDICQQEDFIFVKTANTKEQVMPKGGENLYEILKPFINLTEEDYQMFLIYLVQCFFPNSSHFIAIISSAHGSGKSTLTRLIRRIVDPAIAGESFMPNSIEELKNHLINNTFVAFDNTERLKNDVSDLLCSAVTGTYITKRELYTTSEECIFRLKNIVILNGINIVPKKPDLLERSLLFELKQIPANSRKTDKEFWSEFERELPYIMGAIFDIIVVAIRIRKELKLTKAHRMADAFYDMVAIAMAMDLDEKTFRGLFEANKEKIEKIHADENYFVNIIVEYMESRNNQKIVGKVSDIYKDIKEADSMDVKYLPKTASMLSRKLKEEKEALEIAGYKFDIQQKSDASYLTIQKIPERAKR